MAFLGVKPNPQPHVRMPAWRCTCSQGRTVSPSGQVLNAAFLLFFLRGHAEQFPEGERIPPPVSHPAWDMELLASEARVRGEVAWTSWEHLNRVSLTSTFVTAFFC